VKKGWRRVVRRGGAPPHTPVRAEDMARVRGEVEELLNARERQLRGAGFRLIEGEWRDEGGKEERACAPWRCGWGW